MSEKPSTVEMTLDDALAYALRLQQGGQVEAAAQLYARILEKAPSHVDALHFLGLATFQLGDGEAAVHLIRRAIALKPDFVGAHNNLGNVLKHLQRSADAAQAYRRVIELDPQNADAYNNLGALLRSEGRAAEAEAALRRALELAPQHADAFHNLGNVLVELQRDDEAADMYIQASRLRPYNAENYLRLARALYGLRRERDALMVYEKWLAVEPDSCEAQHMVAAASGRAVPGRASDAYVQHTFDRFAESFDAVLKRLEYRAPQLLVDSVVKGLGEAQGQLDVLDAGCGTGLCGILLKAWARRLVGVDLSPKMVEKARLREVYDHLVVDELTVYLSQHRAAFDLVVSADTLCYFGDLTAVVSAAAASLRPTGRLGFTLERAEES
ncbi:MAG: tetratricopeptide repeat protein, partial [Candidatus Tectomicrobia bacterium]|nr:tetratricopeptide repeat protein [Candidatus Tectomicrobia bacterium]